MPSDKSFAEKCASVREEVLAMAKADAERAKFVRVRIPVAVMPNGEWYVPQIAFDSADPYKELCDDWYGWLSDPHHIAWIEADVPLPQGIVVEGKVRE
jgi:hypothetical protein